MIMAVFLWDFFFFIKFKQFVCLLLAKIYGFCCYHCLVQDLSFNSGGKMESLIFDKITSILSTSVTNKPKKKKNLVWVLRVNGW